MENLLDYSNYVYAAYSVSLGALGFFVLYVLLKYWRFKIKQNEKK